MKKYFNAISFLLLFIFPVYAFSQQDSALRKQIKQIVAPVKGIVGVSVLGIESRDTLTFNGNARLVMHSVMKFPIAIAVMHYIDSGVLKPELIVHIKRKDLTKDSYSPIRDKYPTGDIDISVHDLLGLMVSQSDNNACDILLNLIGGTQTVENYIVGVGIRGISVQASEADMASAWEIQYTNWAKPISLTKLLDYFYQSKTLTKASTDMLYKMLTEATTGPKRIKAGLPEGTIFAHKTGSSPTNDAGLSPATNDVGIITLPNGKHLALAIMVCNSTNDEATREGTIAKIAKVVWEYYAK